MRTDQLKCLMAIGEKGSINAASEELHLTPQAVSVSIKNLETELGLPLLQKTTKHTYLTDYGQKLVEASQEFFLKVEDIQAKRTQQRLPPAGTVQILATPGVNNSLLPYMVCDFMSIAPELDFHIQVLEQHLLFEQLRTAGDVVGLLFYDKNAPYYSSSAVTDAFEFFPLLNCQIVAQIPRNHALSAYNSLSIRSLLPQPILLNTNAPDKSLIAQLLYHYGKPAKIICEENPSIYAEMLSRGLGIAFTLMLPLKPAQSLSNTNLRTVSIKEIPEIYLSYVLRKNTLYSDLTIQFLEQLADYLKATAYPFSSFIL